MVDGHPVRQKRMKNTVYEGNGTQISEMSSNISHSSVITRPVLEYFGLK
ncbi:2700_t:CDS:2 [Rhizophagus irregularis]|nr:2700_t:CDS:2 [Rhizophagus irregularis]